MMMLRMRFTYLSPFYLLISVVLKFVIACEKDIGDEHMYNATSKDTCFTKEVSLCIHLCKLK